MQIRFTTGARHLCSSTEAPLAAPSSTGLFLALTGNRPSGVFETSQTTAIAIESEIARFPPGSLRWQEGRVNHGGLSAHWHFVLKWRRRWRAVIKGWRTRALTHTLTNTWGTATCFTQPPITKLSWRLSHPPGGVTESASTFWTCSLWARSV